MTEAGRVLRRWVGATWMGWLLGVPLVAALALLGEVVRIGGSQTPVGLGMGIGVGLVQGRAIRRVLPIALRWFWSCAVGLAIPFLVADVSKAAGWGLAYSLPWCVALGGLLASVWQALMLRQRFDRSWPWIAASIVGWTLAAGAAAAADFMSRAHPLRGLPGALAFLGIVASGGLFLGVVTGLALAWMLRRVRTGSASRARA